MSTIHVPVTRNGFGRTSRPDAWWVVPFLTFLGLGAFVVYVTWAAFQGNHYRFGPYLSPLYSPEIFGDPKTAWFGGRPGWIPSFLPFTPALFVLWAPGGFRFSCYYYRGAYYKAFWADPPSCSVGEPRKSYCGEASFPLILQNIHRYFLVVALIFLPILWHDVWEGFWFDTGFGVHVGSLILLANTILLTGYSLGCHTFRHQFGGILDQLSRHPIRKQGYRMASCFNRAHMQWAWASLFSVAFSDLYVRLCSMHIWTDWRIF
ncbi:MAG: succinate dehydrogenase [Bryobacterales bacterium]|nr:succinate dehydrogenase [Bryobacterales bacterium]